MITTTKYCICDSTFSRFAYIDLGVVKYDEKMPRRSGTFTTLEDAQKALTRFVNLVKKYNNEMIDALNVRCSYEESPSRIEQLKAEIDAYNHEINTVSFEIVVFSISKLPQQI